METVIVIKNSQRRIKVNHQRVRRTLRRALAYLNDRRASSVRRQALTDKGKISLGATRSTPDAPRSLEVSVLFVNDRMMRELNLTYRGIDRTTDVLSFPQYSRDELSVMSNELKDASRITHHASLQLGDIVISPAKARLQARELGLTFYEEITRLLVHGLLHLLGYDHEKNAYQARRMRKLEEELFKETQNTNFKMQN